MWIKRKGKGEIKENRKIFGFWLQLACLQHYCLRFLKTCNHIWKGFFMVSSSRKGKRMTKDSHTHKFTKCELKYASQTTISMHDENIPITNPVVFVLSLWFVISLQAFVFLKKLCFNLEWWNTCVPYQGPESCTTFKITPARWDHWALTLDSCRVPLPPDVMWISWCPQTSEKSSLVVLRVVKADRDSNSRNMICLGLFFHHPLQKHTHRHTQKTVKLNKKLELFTFFFLNFFLVWKCEGGFLCETLLFGLCRTVTSGWTFEFSITHANTHTHAHTRVWHPLPPSGLCEHPSQKQLLGFFLQQSAAQQIKDFIRNVLFERAQHRGSTSLPCCRR